MPLEIQGSLTYIQQMQKIANRGSISLGVSAGIDSTMCLSWLVKNKVDFNTFTWIEDPWKGDLNRMVSENAVEMTRRLGVQHTLIDYSSAKFNRHDLIRDYCEADGYDFPQAQTIYSYMSRPPGTGSYPINS